VDSVMDGGTPLPGRRLRAGRRSAGPQLRADSPAYFSDV